MMRTACTRLVWAAIVFVAGCRQAPEHQSIVPDSSASQAVPSASPTQVSPDSARNQSAVPAQFDIVARGRAVLAALKARDARQLATFVHPDRGVRFTPYPYVRADSDVVLSRDAVLRIFSDSTPRLWGHADGSGEPLAWPFDRYYARYVYDADFVEAPVVRVDQPPAHAGNSPSNLREVYPSARWVEFHFPGIHPKYEGMDWRSLWLVFEPRGDAWFLTGIVHGSWTI